MEEKKSTIDKTKFDEYKMIIDDTARFTDRRQNVSNLYVTVNSLLLTAIAFIAKDANLKQFWILLFSIPLAIAGIFISSSWKQLLGKYKKLNRIRFDVLWEMEDDEALDGIEKMYHKENELYPRDKKGKIIQGLGLNFSDLESKLPMMFIVLYGVALVGIVGMLISAM